MERIFTVAIGLTEVFFFSKLSDRVLDPDNVNESVQCDDGLFNDNTADTPAARDARIRCREDKNKQLEAIASKKFTFMIILATLLLVAVNSANTTPTVKNGTSIGALLMIIFTMFTNWTRLDENVKLLSLGVSLGFLIYGASKIVR